MLELNSPFNLTISEFNLSFSCFKKAIAFSFPEPELKEVFPKLVISRVNLSFSCLRRAIVLWSLDELVLYYKVETLMFNLSFSCFRRAIVFSFVLCESALVFNKLTSLVSLSFSCLKRTILLSCPVSDVVLLSEAFSISTILALKRSTYLYFSHNKLWIVSQSFSDPTISPMILAGSSSLTTKSDLIHCPKSECNIEN